MAMNLRARLFLSAFLCTLLGQGVRSVPIHRDQHIFEYQHALRLEQDHHGFASTHHAQEIAVLTDEDLPQKPAGDVGGGITPVAVPFPISDVSLTNGSRFAVMQERNIDYLLHLNSTSLLCIYTMAANITGTIANPTCVPYLHPQYYGHYLGHFMSATALAYNNTGRRALREKAAGIVAELGACQEAWSAAGHQGYLFPYDPIAFANLEGADGHPPRNCDPVCVPFYVLHKVMAGLLDQYNLAGNEQAFGMLKQIAAWVKRNVEGVLLRGGEALWQQVLNTEWGGMNEVLYNLYGVTGDPAHLQTGYYFNHYSWTAPLAVDLDDLTNQHANTHIPEVVGSARGFELTGNKTQKDIAVNFFSILNRTRTFSTGGSNDNEHWGAPHRLGDQMNAATEESCTTYNILKVARHLFEWSGNASYSDFYERALYNGILGNQDRDSPAFGQPQHTTGFIYMLPLGGGGIRKGWGASDQNFPCCWGTLSETFSKLSDSIYFRSPDHSALYVNLFAPSTLRWAARGLELTQTTDYPKIASTTTTITVAALPAPPGAAQGPAAAAAATWTLRLRVPFWATGANEVRVNGDAWGGSVEAGTYASIERAWKPGDRVEASFPMALRFEQLNDLRTAWQGVGALMYGPTMLAGLTRSDTLIMDVQRLDHYIALNASAAGPPSGPREVAFTARDECGATAELVPFNDVTSQEYSTYFHTRPRGPSSSAPAPPSLSSTVKVDAEAVALSGGAAVMPNHSDENIRTGGPGDVSLIAISPALRDPSHTIKSVAIQYRFVDGYGPTLASVIPALPPHLAAHRHHPPHPHPHPHADPPPPAAAPAPPPRLLPGAEGPLEALATNMSLVLLRSAAWDEGGDPCAPLQEAVLARSPPLVGYPYDKCPTCYSPAWTLQANLTSSALLQELKTLGAGTNGTVQIALKVYNNNRNAQLLLPLTLEIEWA